MRNQAQCNGRTKSAAIIPTGTLLLVFLTLPVSAHQLTQLDPVSALIARGGDIFLNETFTNHVAPIGVDTASKAVQFLRYAKKLQHPAAALK